MPTAQAKGVQHLERGYAQRGGSGSNGWDAVEMRLRRPVRCDCVLSQSKQDDACLPIPAQIGGSGNTGHAPSPAAPKAVTPGHVHPDRRRDRVPVKTKHTGKTARTSSR